MATLKTSDQQTIYYLLESCFSRFENKYQSLLELSGAKPDKSIDFCLSVNG